jgi:quinol monooxygenase YgiN
MTADTQIHVLARITLRPGTRPAWLDAFRALRPHVIAEDGCLAYEATADVPGVLGAQTLAGEDTVVIVERWRDEAALKAHSTAPHMAPYRAATKPLVAEVRIEVLRAV